MTDESSIDARLQEAEEEELILIVSKSCQSNDPVLSLLDEYDQESEIVYLKTPTLYLQPSARVNGTICATVRRMGRKGYSSKNIRELYLGKIEVVEFCKKNDLEIHADWIENLREPYRIPIVSSIQWVSPEKQPRLRKSDKW